MRAPAALPYAVLMGAFLVALAEPRAGSGTNLVISSADCRRLVTRHAPSPDVYRPGVDVRGRAVAPADLDSATRIRLPERIDIDIIVALGEFLGAGTPPRTAGAEVRVGTVTLEGEHLSFNGQALGDTAAAAIAAACRKALARE